MFSKKFVDMVTKLRKIDYSGLLCYSKIDGDSCFRSEGSSSLVVQRKVSEENDPSEDFCISNSDFAKIMTLGAEFPVVSKEGSRIKFQNGGKIVFIKEIVANMTRTITETANGECISEIELNSDIINVIAPALFAAQKTAVRLQTVLSLLEYEGHLAIVAVTGSRIYIGKTDTIVENTFDPVYLSPSDLELFYQFVSSNTDPLLQIYSNQIVLSKDGFSLSMSLMNPMTNAENIISRFDKQIESEDFNISPEFINTVRTASKFGKIGTIFTTGSGVTINLNLTEYNGSTFTADSIESARAFRATVDLELISSALPHMSLGKIFFGTNNADQIVLEKTFNNGSGRYFIGKMRETQGN